MTSVCPRCGTALDRAVHGLCARCLLDCVLGEEAGPSDDPARFRIVTLLGKGAHGTTYLAEQDEEPRFVSLKMLDGDAAEAARPRLRLLGPALIECRHPCLVPIVSVNLEPAPAIAAEYLQGRKAAATDGDVIAELAGIASALAHLHACGVVHANIHAGNVLTVPAPAPRPRWRLIDLAAARPLESSADAAIDLVAFGAFMRRLLAGDAAAQASDVIDRALRAGTRDGYGAAADLAADLRSVYS